jgi:transposase-like protein
VNLSELSQLTEDQARHLLERIRWPNGPVCPHCGVADGHTKFKGKKHRPGVYKCNAGCGEQFTVTVNSVMEGSHISIRHWLMAFAMMCSSKKGVSALQIQRQLGLGSYRSAWHLAHRVRHAMTQEPLAGMLKGHVEADETYVGGKPRPGNNAGRKSGRGTSKTPVMVLVERDGKAHARVIKRVDARTLKGAIRELVHRDSMIFTDEWAAYRGIGKEYRWGHHTVNHSKGEYYRGGAHTNTAESYFALLKRGVTGSFHHVSKKHLHRYCEEFSFRWNYRKSDDGSRTIAAIEGAAGKRLMYKTPVAKQ